MLEIGLIVGAAIGFYKLAQNNGLKGWIWSVLAILGYFAGAFTAGLVIGVFAPDMLYDELALTFIGLGAGAVGILAVYLILKMQINKKANEVSDSGLLNNEI